MNLKSDTIDTAEDGAVLYEDRLNAGCHWSMIMRKGTSLRLIDEQGGANVSGGQRQRLAIARAVVREPSVYIFDDSFSALDLATDARLRAALKPHTADAAVLVVAQRVSTIVDADQILVMSAGRVIERGTHTELLAQHGTYHDMWEMQRKEREEIVGVVDSGAS